MMIAVAVVPSFRAFSNAKCHKSASTRIDRSGVIFATCFLEPTLCNNVHLCLCIPKNNFLYLLLWK